MQLWLVHAVRATGHLDDRMLPHCSCGTGLPQFDFYTSVLFPLSSQSTYVFSSIFRDGFSIRSVKYGYALSVSAGEALSDLGFFRVAIVEVGLVLVLHCSSVLVLVLSSVQAL